VEGEVVEEVKALN